MFLHLLCLPFIFSIQSRAQLVSIVQQVKALYVFGDSIVDSGLNLNRAINASYSPYGCDFRIPASGRFTNGNTIPDMLGKKKGTLIWTSHNSIKLRKQQFHNNAEISNCKL